MLGRAKERMTEIFYHVDELREFELDSDREGVADVGYRPHQFVIVGQ